MKANMKRSWYGKGKSMKGIDYVNSMHKMLQSSIAVHTYAHLLHVYPVCAQGLSSKQRNSLVHSLSLSQDLQRQEVKYRIRDNDLENIFS